MDRRSPRQHGQRTAERGEHPDRREGSPILAPAVVDVGELRAGTILNGRYRLEGPLALGGMSEIYRATDLESGDSVALKLLPQRFRTQPLLARFDREVRLAVQVRHPNVVTTYDGGVLPEGVPYLVMELLEGPTVRSVVREQGPMPLERACEVLRAVLAGVEAAHALGVVHRDIKPSNVLLGRDGAVKLIDFGLSLELQGSGEKITGPGEALGTPSYMSPEQVLADEADARTDVWGAGVLFYEMVTGVRAFPRVDGPVHRTFGRILEEEPAPPSSIRPELPAEVDAFVARALAKSKADRFQSAAEMAAACPSRREP